MFFEIYTTRTLDFFSNFIFFTIFRWFFSTYIGGGQKYALTWFLILTLSALPECEMHTWILVWHVLWIVIIFARPTSKM